MHARDVVERLAISLGGEVEHTDGQTVIRWPKYIGYSASERWAWQHMLKRCTDPKHPAWDRYGGRGIKVCDRWANSFAAFAEDMGPKPHPDMTLDRIDNDGDYSPENCRWATRSQQMRNMSRNHLLTIDGETLPVVAWAERVGLCSSTLYARLYAGWAPKDAVHTKKTRNRLIQVGSEALTVQGWSDRYGIAPQTIRARLRLGWDAEKAVTQPSQRKHR